MDLINTTELNSEKSQQLLIYFKKQIKKCALY